MTFFFFLLFSDTVFSSFRLLRRIDWSKFELHRGLSPSTPDAQHRAINSRCFARVKWSWGGEQRSSRWQWWREGDFIIMNELLRVLCSLDSRVPARERREELLLHRGWFAFAVSRSRKVAFELRLREAPRRRVELCTNRGNHDRWMHKTRLKSWSRHLRHRISIALHQWESALRTFAPAVLSVDSDIKWYLSKALFLYTLKVGSSN